VKQVNSLLKEDFIDFTRIFELLVSLEAQENGIGGSVWFHHVNHIIQLAIVDDYWILDTIDNFNKNGSRWRRMFLDKQKRNN
ncbi:MAG: hypothetical protein AAF740_10525, partial [Bacteroidota bacterium]